MITTRDIRQGHAVEAQPHRTEAEREQLACLTEVAPDLALIGNPDGRMVWMNRAGRALLGFGLHENIGAYRIEDLFSPTEMARIYAEDMPVIARDGDWQGRWVLQARDGTQIPVEVAQHVHHDEKGACVYVSGIMRDLRPRLAKQREQRQVERRLAAAERVAGLGSWEWDPVSNEVKWSPGMYQLHGMVLGNGNECFDAWVATVHPDDRAMAVEETRKAVASGSGIDFSYRALRRDRGEFIIQARGEIILDEHGAPVSMIGTLLDITDRHAAAEALRESEERARSVIATAGDAYVQYDGNGVVAEWNHQAEKTFGWTRGEAIGQQLSRLVIPPHERPAYERGLASYTNPAEVRLTGKRLEARAVHRSGREFPVEVTSWPIVGHQPLMVGSFIRDISERLAAERAKDEFLSVVGHELRTPLTSVHGAFGLLGAGLLGELNDRGRQIVEIAAHSTQRLVRLINDILDIERLSSGKVSLARQECDIAALGERSLEVMRQMGDAAGVCLEIDAKPAVAWADPDRVEQLLTNLLSNAIKFSPTGATVSVIMRTNATEVTVEVRDRGRGIPHELLEVVFGRFQQVDGSDAREKGGTGLGLAICRTIVEQHGGRIWAGPTGSCEGATLTFTLPVVASHEQPADTPRPRVLLHGGEASVHHAVAAMVHRHGYEPVTAPTGTDLLEAAIQHRPVAILLDIHMRAAAGWQRTAALRDRTETREIPVLVLDLNGGDAEGASSAAVNAGDEPFDADALVVCLTRATEAVEGGAQIVLVEPDQSLAGMLTKRISQVGIEVHHAPSAQRATAICDHLVPDLLALSMSLPDLDRHAVLAHLAADDRLVGKPVIMYTAGDRWEPNRKRMRREEGGSFTKPYATPEEFERCVGSFLDRLAEDKRDPANA